MNKNKNNKLSIFFIASSIVFLNIMTSRIAIEYCNRNNAIKYGRTNDSTVNIFLIILPHMLMIAATAFNAYFLWNKSEEK